MNDEQTLIAQLESKAAYLSAKYKTLQTELLQNLKEQVLVNNEIIQLLEAEKG